MMKGKRISVNIGSGCSVAYMLELMAKNGDVKPDKAYIEAETFTERDVRGGERVTCAVYLHMDTE